MRTPHAALALSLLAAHLVGGCRDGPVAPASGALVVWLAPAGVDFDPDGFTLSVDGGPGRPIRPGVPFRIEYNTPGSHSLRLMGYPENCQVDGANPRVVEVVLGREMPVTFVMTCVPRVGSARVITTTTGDEIDVDGYRLTVDDEDEYYGPGTPVAANGTVTLNNLYAGEHVLALRGVARNCTIEGSHRRTVNIPFGGSIDVAFAVECVTSGALQVTAATSGADPDANGYQVRLEGAGFDSLASIAAGGSVTASRLPPGEYRATLRDVSPNCDIVGSNPLGVVVVSGGTAAAHFDVTCAPATQIAFAANVDGNYDIYVIKSNGAGLTRLTMHSAADTAPAWSPGGSRIAFVSARDGNPEIYVMNADGGGAVRLTDLGSRDYHPAWSPDGQRIAFVSDRDGNAEIYIVNADGTNPVRLTNHVGSDADPAWSPDGTRIAFRSTRDGNDEIYVMNADGSGVTRLTNSGEFDGNPDWSPDGFKIAFARGDCYSWYGCFRGIFVMNADGSGVTRLTSGNEDDTQPSWSPDAEHIAFTASCHYYDSCYYNPTTSIMIVRADGSDLSELTNSNASKPSWRR